MSSRPSSGAAAVFSGIVGAEPFRDIATSSVRELAERDAAVQRAQSTLDAQPFAEARHAAW